jgi:KDO2-lipid IV(A) lauroyltransferase
MRYHIMDKLMRLKLTQPQAERLGRALGTIAWAVDPVHRRVADTQLKAALGMHSPGSLAVMRMQGELVMETLRLMNQTEAATLAELQIHGREHLEQAKTQAQTEGRGIMILTAHIGPWEVMSWLVKALDFNFSIMADQRDDKRLESLIQRMHTVGGATILPPKGGMLKLLIGELRSGRAIGFMPDQRGNRSNRVLCDFFGLPAPTNPAPAYIALLGDALIVPCYALKTGRQIGIHIEPAIDVRDFPQDLTPAVRYRDAWQSSGVQELSTAMQRVIENVISQNPTQWFWVHSRWTRRKNMKKLARERRDFTSYINEQAELIRSGNFGLPGGQP